MDGLVLFREPYGALFQKTFHVLILRTRKAGKQFNQRWLSGFFVAPQCQILTDITEKNLSFPGRFFNRIDKYLYLFLAEMTKFFVILEAAIINTSFVSMVLPLQFILLYLYFIILYRLMQQIFHEFFITYFSAVTVHRPIVIS
jgi:hypothetical protein